MIPLSTRRSASRRRYEVLGRSSRVRTPLRRLRAQRRRLFSLCPSSLGRSTPGGIGSYPTLRTVRVRLVGASPSAPTSESLALGPGPLKDGDDRVDLLGARDAETAV